MIPIAWLLINVVRNMLPVVIIKLAASHNMQGVVTAMCPVLPAATAIKVKSRDQAHRRATIKGSRWCSGHINDQNQNKMLDVA